ncbi:hypothetical protein, partial [Enterobacter intestinihominis]
MAPPTPLQHLTLQILNIKNFFFNKNTHTDKKKKKLLFLIKKNTSPTTQHRVLICLFPINKKNAG